MTIKFQTASTPTLTPDEFKTKQASSGGKYITSPGVYSVTITGVEVRGPATFKGADPTWINVLFKFEDSEGKQGNHFVEVPTTAANNYMYGSRKSLANYNNLEKFLKGFGVSLEFTEAITQLETLFSDAEKTFIGKTLSLRIGYTNNYTKYVGKNGEVSEYQIVDRDGTPVVSDKFSGFDAAKAYAEANAIKLQGFPKVLEVIPATTASISLNAPKMVSLPF